MTILDLVLLSKKTNIWERFLSFGNRNVPENVATPRSPEDALAVGYRMGLQAGYSKGLVDGADIGLAFGACITTPASMSVVSSIEPFDVC